MKFILISEIVTKEWGSLSQELTSFDEDWSAWASKWLLLIRDFIFLVEAITDIGTVADPKHMDECYFSYKYNVLPL